MLSGRAMDIPADLIELLSAFADADVRYLLVGGPQDRRDVRLLLGQSARPHRAPRKRR
jgi:hypothetical protein